MSETTRRIGRPSFSAQVRRLGLGIPILLAAACGGEQPDSLAGADASVGSVECVDRDGDGFGSGCTLGADCNDEDPSVTNECYRCSTPDEGCPCGDEGAEVKCGKVETRTDESVTCKMGVRACHAGAWGACLPDDAADTKSLITKGLGGVSGCVGNPCDPYCKSFPDSPDGTLTNDAGVVGTEAGLTVVPTPIDAGPPVTCADTTAEPVPVQLDMVVMFDKSGSMAGTRWSSATTAFKNYVGSADAKGVGMAINYFALEIKDTCCDWFGCWSCSSYTCNTADYANYGKYGVAMGVLPGSMSGHAVTIRDSLNAQSPETGTPTQPALAGALDYARTWQTANPTHRTISVLVTDGEPNDCSSTVTNTAATASAGFSGSPSITTYVIGVGSALSNLDTIAKAGSGGKETYIPVPSGDTTAFVNAMKKIKVKAAGCDYTVPVAPSGDVDPSATDVTLSYTPSGTTSTLPRKTSAADCGTGNGYYYDSATDPKKLYLCPTTCTTVGSNLDYKVEMVFKCKPSCGKGSFKADPIPIGMYVMLDKSGSMGGSRWTNVTKALKDFINNPASAGIAVGLDYFPQTSPSSDYCVEGNYSTPSVSIGMLPGNATTLVSNINATSPSGNTPTRPALRGAITYARSFATANPTYKTIVVLATDGEPTMCGSSNNTTYIGDNVAKAYGMDMTPQIPTYVIGVGSGVAASGMDYIASRGGTGKAYMVNDGSSTSFEAAMDDIRKRTLSCDFTVPPTTLGVMDPATMQVRYTDGTSVDKVPRVAGAGACGTSPGWYPDNPTAPTKIFLCPATCTDVKALEKADLYVFYDCVNGGDGTFTRDYQIDCPVGTKPVWGYWSWNASTPGDSTIDFSVTTGSTIAELGTNPEKPLLFTNPPGPSSLAGSPIGVRSSPVDTQVGFAYVDTSLATGGLSRNAKFLRIRAHIKGTTATPILSKWNQEVSCIPSE